MRTNSKSDITIELATPESTIYEYGTMASIKYFSEKEREIIVKYQNQTIFKLTVPKVVFNPYNTIVAPILLDMILKEDINVKDKNFIDLGCGCGILGFGAIIKGAKSVLFTDINPNIHPIEQNELFRPGLDRVAVQSFCANEPANSSDLVLIATPGTVTDEPLDPNSIDTSFYRTPDFLKTMIKNIAKVLSYSGKFVFWYRIHPQQVHIFAEFIMLLSKYFDTNSLQCLLEYTDEKEKGCIGTVFSITKK